MEGIEAREEVFVTKKGQETEGKRKKRDVPQSPEGEC